MQLHDNMIYMGFPLGGWLSGVDAVLAAACAWIALGAAAMAAPASLRLSARILYPAGALVGPPPLTQPRCRKTPPAAGLPRAALLAWARAGRGGLR